MIEVKFLKDWEGVKKGEVVEMALQGAKAIIKEGIAEYVEEQISEEQSIGSELQDAVKLMKNIKKEIGKDKSVREYLDNKKYLEPVNEPKLAKKIASEQKLKSLMEEGIVFEPETKKQKNKKKRVEVFGRRGQLESFWEQQPFFYDKAKIFWLWNEELKKWDMSDEVDFLNNIQETLGIETIDGKAKAELIEGFRQVGRKHTPSPIKKEWVQFKDKIIDPTTDEVFEASPKYFVKNPIPHKIGKSEDTPIIDKLFVDWVGEEKKQQLYENTAYNTTPHKFMQRIKAFCGGGSNGKGTYIKLQYSFLGKENCVTSELKNLSEDKFEPAVLFGKLLCVMGEISHDDLKNTNQLKKLGGEDMMSFQFKGKTPFTDDNTATIVGLTNQLPTTPDKSMGFYRKIHIIDFPNQFQGIKQDLIESIPEVEFENLAFKSINILKDLYKTRKFTGEGTFEERQKKYEEHSNPVMRFFEEHCEEDYDANTPLREFTNKFNEFSKNKHLRVMSAIQVGKVLRSEGFAVSQRKIDNISAVVILNLSIISKEKPLEPLEPSKSGIETLRETNEKSDGLGGSNGSQREIK